MTTEQRLAKAHKPDIIVEDHGILTVSLQFSYSRSSVQGLPGYALDEWEEQRKERIGTAYGMEFVRRLMLAFGVHSFNDIAGRTVYAHLKDGLIVGIEPLPTEPGKDFMFEELREQFELGAVR